MSEWKEYRLGDVGKIVTGKTPSTKVSSYYDGSIHFVSPADLNNCNKEILSTAKTISSSGLMAIKGSILPKRAICVSCIGNLGYVGITKMECASNQQINSIIVDESYFDIDFIYYTIKWLWRYFKSQENQSTTISIINKSTFANIKFSAPDINLQKKIAILLSEIDSKIENNRKICANLEAQAQALFKHCFIDFAPFKDRKFVESELGMIPEGWRVSAAMDLYNINIGKTPPRQEPIWFSKDQNDVKWISISDLGKSGIFIMDSSEKLTKEAIKKHHIIVVPKNTILLSFKLTIGRVAICNSDMTTNEAIARFYLNDKSEMEYLYMYLKNYKYELLGSTSSIATAVNSKIIKKMCILKPPFEVINKFHSVVNPLFERIRANIEENDRLSTLRDTLLPKLMSGEIKV